MFGRKVKGRVERSCDRRRSKRSKYARLEVERVEGRKEEELSRNRLPLIGDVVGRV